MDVRIRPERAADVERTFAVVEAAFRHRLEAELVNALRRSASPQISLVAEADGGSPGTVPAPPARQRLHVSVLRRGRSRLTR